MPATITCHISDMPRLFKKLGDQVRPTLERGARSGALQMLPIMVRQTDQAKVASPRGSRGAVNTGEYRRRWTALPGVNSSGHIGVQVANSSPYAGVIEFGRRPGSRPPPREPIARWAQRKLGLPYEQASRMAYVIARRIGKRGLWPRHVLTSEQTTRLLLEALERDVLTEIIATLRNTTP